MVISSGHSTIRVPLTLEERMDQIEDEFADLQAEIDEEPDNFIDTTPLPTSDLIAKINSFPRTAQKLYDINFLNSILAPTTPPSSFSERHLRRLERCKLLKEINDHIFQTDSFPPTDLQGMVLLVKAQQAYQAQYDDNVFSKFQEAVIRQIDRLKRWKESGIVFGSPVSHPTAPAPTPEPSSTLTVPETTAPAHPHSETPPAELPSKEAVAKFKALPINAQKLYQLDFLKSIKERFKGFSYHSDRRSLLSDIDVNVLKVVDAPYVENHLEGMELTLKAIEAQTGYSDDAFEEFMDAVENQIIILEKWERQGLSFKLPTLKAPSASAAAPPASASPAAAAPAAPRDAIAPAAPASTLSPRELLIERMGALPHVSKWTTVPPTTRYLSFPEIYYSRLSELRTDVMPSYFEDPSRFASRTESLLAILASVPEIVDRAPSIKKDFEAELKDFFTDLMSSTRRYGSPIALIRLRFNSILVNINMRTSCTNQQESTTADRIQHFFTTRMKGEVADTTFEETMSMIDQLERSNLLDHQVRVTDIAEFEMIAKKMEGVKTITFKLDMSNSIFIKRMPLSLSKGPLAELLQNPKYKVLVYHNKSRFKARGSVTPVPLILSSHARESCHPGLMAFRISS